MNLIKQALAKHAKNEEEEKKTKATKKSSPATEKFEEKV